MFTFRLLVAPCIFAILPCALSAQPAKPPAPKDGPLGMKFVPLPKGTTYLGWNGTPGSAKKTEIQEDFEIAIYTVTQGQWQELMGNNPSYFSRTGRGKEKVKDIKDDDLKQFPVENVSWHDAQEFIRKLNEKEHGKGFQYRLPTSEEWEYACRGGATSEEGCSYHFYFARPTNDLSTKQANFNGDFLFGKADKKESFLGRTAKVGSYTPNTVGLYDMHGNVWQWCEDLWQKELRLRVIRGGSWGVIDANCRTAARAGYEPIAGYAALGFRLVRLPMKDEPLSKPEPDLPKANSAPVSAWDPASLAGRRIIFLGDSNTQAGGYVNFTTYYLEKLYPKKDFDIIGLGLASETLSGLSEDGHAGGKFPRPCLFERLDRVLEKAKPEVVFACYGMNDGIYLPLDKDRTTAFQKGVTKLIEKCQKGGAKHIYLITPPIYDFMPKKGEFNYDVVLAEYAKWEMGLKIDGLTVIDLHTAMRQARDGRTTPFSGDKVHPGDDGHLLMARTILAPLGAKAPDEKLADIKADPLFKLVAQKRALRSTAWMKHIGYTREKTVQPGPLGTAEADAAKLQEQIDALRRKK